MALKMSVNNQSTDQRNEQNEIINPKYSTLNPDHTHFILVDDGSECNFITI
jgi:hypothetical protein